MEKISNDIKKNNFCKIQILYPYTNIFFVCRINIIWKQKGFYNKQKEKLDNAKNSIVFVKSSKDEKIFIE